MTKEKRINTEENINYKGLKTVVKKNFYAVGFDKKSKKDVITKFEKVTKLQARHLAENWAAREGVILKGVYIN